MKSHKSPPREDRGGWEPWGRHGGQERPGAAGDRSLGAFWAPGPAGTGLRTSSPQSCEGVTPAFPTTSSVGGDLPQPPEQSNGRLERVRQLALPPTSI